MGSRTKLTADFMRELAEDFGERGRDAIVECREQTPAKYLQIIASLMPKDVHIGAQPLAQWTDDELSDAIVALQRWTAAGSPDIGIERRSKGRRLTSQRPRATSRDLAARIPEAVVSTEPAATNG